MYADPKISLAPGFGPAAGFIRQARILLEHQLRQDKAFGHPVSAQRYRLPDGVTCVILHEYERTYIQLNHAAPKESITRHEHVPYQFLNFLTAPWQYIPTNAYFMAWASVDGSAWVNLPVPAILSEAVNYGSAQCLQLSKTTLFVSGMFYPKSQQLVGWALTNPQNLDTSAPQAFPLLNGLPVVEAAFSAYVGGTVVCIALRTTTGNYLTWFDYQKNQYIYVLNYEGLGINDPNKVLSASNSLVDIRPVPLTRTGQHAMVFFSVVVSGEALLFTADVTTQTFTVLGGLPVGFTGAYYPTIVTGAQGAAMVSLPTAASSDPALQTGTSFYFLTPQQGSNYSGLNYPQVGIGAGYTPIGWTAGFQSVPSDLYFFDSSKQLGMVPRSNGVPCFVNYVVTPNGIYDVMGGGYYYSPTQAAAQSLGVPPYSAPSNPNYALALVGLQSQAFYLGPQIAPWLNLYN